MLPVDTSVSAGAGVGESRGIADCVTVALANAEEVAVGTVDG
jgi:hypothetical protein